MQLPINQYILSELFASYCGLLVKFSLSTGVRLCSFELTSENHNHDIWRQKTRIIAVKACNAAVEYCFDILQVGPIMRGSTCDRQKKKTNRTE